MNEIDVNEIDVNEIDVRSEKAEVAYEDGTFEDGKPCAPIETGTPMDTGEARAQDASSGTAALDEVALDGRCMALLQDVRENQSRVSDVISELSGQQAYMRQQQGQLYLAVDQLYKAVSAQCQQLLQSDLTLQQAVRQELGQFQTGGPQRAMAAVFHKLFRDLIGHVTQLDEMADVAITDAAEAGSSSWLQAIRVSRDRFEAILKDWGCTPIPIRVGEEEFDPEKHEAAPVEAAVGGDASTNVIVQVRRRGWMLQGQILQYPLVVVH